jgi:hypothetical protein
VLNFIRNGQRVLTIADQLAAFFCFMHHLRPHQAASVVSWTGSSIEGSSFSGLLTRVEIGHIRISSAGNGRIRSRGSTRIIISGENDGHSVMNVGHKLVGISGDDHKSAGPFTGTRVLPIFPDTGNAEGAPSFIAIAYGCFAFWPLIAFHSKKPSTGTMQRRLR